MNLQLYTFIELLSVKNDFNFLSPDFNFLSPELLSVKYDCNTIHHKEQEKS